MKTVWKTDLRLAARLPSGASALGAGASLDGTFVRFFVRLPPAAERAESPLQQQAAAAAAGVGALLGCLTEARHKDSTRDFKQISTYFDVFSMKFIDVLMAYARAALPCTHRSSSKMPLGAEFTWRVCQWAKELKWCNEECTPCNR